MSHRTVTRVEYASSLGPKLMKLAAHVFRLELYTLGEEEFLNLIGVVKNTPR